MIKIKNQVGCKYFIKKGNVRNLPVGGLKQVENASQFRKDVIKKNNENSDEGYFLKLMFKILTFLTFPNDLLFFVFNLNDKKHMSYTKEIKKNL